MELLTAAHKLVEALAPGNDIAPTFAHRNNTMVIPIQSSYFNVLNFIVFDVFLVSAVFLGTGWLTGLGNDYDLKDGRSQRLYLIAPPIIGGGLCGTRRWRGYLFSAMRLAALILVLVSNVCIEGSDSTRIERQERTLLVSGSLANSTLVEVRRAALLGFGCTSLDKDMYTIYGELRMNSENEQVCVTDPKLLDNPLKTGKYVKDAKLKTGNCTSTLLGKGGREGSPIKVDVYAYICEHATLRCNHLNGRFFHESCRGIARSEAGGYYLVDTGNLNPVDPPQHGTYALEVKNKNLGSRDWMDTYPTAVIEQSVLDDVVATTKAFSAVRQVSVRVSTPVTYVSHFWWGLLAIKILLVASLLFFTIWLWMAGFRPVAHDEHGLAQLIANGIEDEWDDASGPRTEQNPSEPSSSRSQIRLLAQDPQHGFIVYAEGYKERVDNNQKYHDYEAQCL